jgi:copper homeostasis protein
MINNKLIEICAGSIEDCATADLFPVDRIELNSAIELGGLTPSVGTLIHAKQVTKLPLCCMVRPRTAGFVYTQHQFESMLFDAQMLLENGADGIVFGFLNEDTTIDVQRTKQMADLIKSYGKEVVFHKAFDKTPDKIKACETLIECGVDRILTSGGENYPHIEQGFDLLKELIEKYNDQITILVGGGVRAHNIHNIIESTNCTQIHMTAKEMKDDFGQYAAVSENNLKEILSNI